MLRELDWVALLEEVDGDRAGRAVLLCDPASTPISPLASRLLLKPDALTGGFWRQAGLDAMTLGQALSA